MTLLQIIAGVFIFLGVYAVADYLVRGKSNYSRKK